MNVFKNFECGSIDLIGYKDGLLRVSLTTTHKGEVNHWFYFGVNGSPNTLTIEIENAMYSRFAKGWDGYKPFISFDNKKWERCNVGFQINEETAFLKLENIAEDTFFISWYPPYSVKKYELYSGFTDFVHQVGNKKGDSILVTARQHPGETMSSFFVEGLLDFLSSNKSAELLSKYNFIIVPFVNIIGVKTGMHRTSISGIDYNFVWFKKIIEEVEEIKSYINDKKVILYFDIHGDEVSKVNYIYYTGRYFEKVKPLLNNLHIISGVSLLHRSRLKYVIKVFLRKRKIIRGIRNTVEYIEQTKKCPGFVYELSAHITNPEECKKHGENLGLAIDEYLLKY